MKEIFKTLNKFKWKIILVLILLVIQAYCNLSLPSYTSDIINIGIGQSGIDSVVPKVMTTKDYDLIFDLLTKEEQELFDKSYKYISIENKDYIEKYPILKKEGIFILKEINEDTLNKLEEILIFPLSLTNSDLEVNINNLNEIKNNYKNNETFIESIGIEKIKNIYIECGIDIEALSLNYIYKTGGLMLFVTFISLIITVGSVYYSSKIASYFARDLRLKLVNKVMSFEQEEIKEFNISSLITRCTNDIVQIQILITVFLRIIIFAPIIGVGASLKVRGSTMAWVIILAVSLILSLMLILFVVVVPKFKKFQDLLDKLNLVSRESLSGIAVIRAFANEKEEEKKFDKANMDLTKNGLFVTRAMAIMSPTITFLMNSVSILIVWVGASKIDTGILEVGDLIAFISYAMQIITAFLMVSMVAVMLPRALVSVKRISLVFNKDIKVKDKINTEKFNSKNINEIEFKDVYFRYPGSTEDVLRNINFKAEKGTITAFIGSTGSGKSTLVNLIPRFFDVTSGKILIDGKNIKDVKITDLREKIGYVPQKGQLFSGTVESNIAFGQKKKDKSLIEEAARISQSTEFINNFENKYEEHISENGTNVSGGQRQRLSIARALAVSPEIYIFDDSSSALDYKTDSILRRELKKITKEKIVFIVAQRISSVMHADKIIVLNEGEIVGVGTHEELLKTCEVYKEIKISQLGGDNDE